MSTLATDRRWWPNASCGPPHFRDVDEDFFDIRTIGVLQQELAWRPALDSASADYHNSASVRISGSHYPRPACPGSSVRKRVPAPLAGRYLLRICTAWGTSNSGRASATR